MSGFTNSVFWLVVISSCLLFQGILGANNIDYKGALRKSLLFYEAQRSGKLPPNQRVQWRGDSGLQDGKDSGDELLWASAWLHRATGEEEYLSALTSSGTATKTAFSWDDKFVGAQVLAAKKGMKGKAELFICNCVQKGSNNVKKTPGGLLWFMEWNNVQYVATASFVTTVYSNYLSANKQTLKCSAGDVSPADLLAAAKTQVDYIVGVNPKGMSYMVGFGTSFPQKIHHRAASIISTKKDPTPVTCKGGFDAWFNNNEANPNVLDGAMVSPDGNDGYSDSRGNYQTAEPTTVSNAPFVGVLAHFA